MRRLLATVLVVSMAPAVVAPGVAVAAGPSVPLPTVPSTPVTQQNADPRQPDAASRAALRPGQGATEGPDGAGTSTATSLAPSSTWDVSVQTGDFTTGYPLRMPPVPGGLAPNLALSYRSSTVDGHTSSTNNQPSWVGEGWDLSPGFVERTYGACAEDDDGGFKPQQIGDLCWRSDNAVAAFDGGGGMLIRDGNTRMWRAKADNGARIERLSGAANGDEGLTDEDRGEHWKITTLDGTQYWFGSQPDSASTWTVPVYGDDSNEPCNKPGSFDTSQCKQAWRWNLDKVVDPNGNVIRYFYKAETNSYGMNLKDAAASYTRGGTLWKVQYGLSERVSGPASAEVEFGVADRCIPGAPCNFDKANWVNWQDTPLDSRCDAATCPTQYSPTFWSTKRLDTITTRVRSGTSYSDVDRWTLDQIYPDPGTGERAALWLRGIKHTGLAGGSLELPSLTFEGAAYPNRVYKPTGDGIGPLNRFRLTGIVSETGGLTSITYASQCRDDFKPEKPETNTMWCFPVTWTKKNLAERTDYFHKYVVAQVIQSDRLYIGSDRTSTSPEQVTSYEYLGGAGWRWDLSEFTKDKKKSWNDFRGFGQVRVRVGKAGDPSGPVTMTEQRFHRGMDGDRLNRDGGTKPQVKLVDSEGTERIDHDWLSGIGYETRTFEWEKAAEPDPPLVSKTLTDQRWWGPLATRGPFKSYRVKTSAERGFTALKSGGWRKTRAETTFDDNTGLPLATNDLGDADAPGDDQCTRTEYAASPLILDLVSTVKTVSVSCATTARYPDNAMSNTRISYDDRGNPLKVEVAKDWAVADRPTYVTASTAGYDEHGRVIAATDAAGSLTKTAYTPKTGGPVTDVETTGPPTPAVPAGMVVRSKLDPASGQPTKITDANNRTTEITYDPLGRKTEVWLANRPRATNTRGNDQFSYRIRPDAPTVVTTTAIGPNGNYTSTKVLFDGLLRPRQQQAPAPGGGRVLTDTRYDSQGRVWKSTQPYFNSANIDDSLWVADDAQVPGLTRTEYDSAGRVKASVYQAGAVEKWRTTTEYGGDRVHVTPPDGGTATTTIGDARGRATELRQYQGATPSGEYDSTLYRYNPAGLLSEVVASGNISWKFGYDLRGNKVRSEDPDTGVTTMTYDDAGRLKTTRDARNAATLALKYDSLSRKIELRRDDLNGPTLATWAYDTAIGGKGQPASKTRYVDNVAYTSSVGSYNELYQPYDATVTIPAVPGLGLLAGKYTWFGTYGQDGTSLSNETYPAAGGLPSETVNYVYDDAGRLRSSSAGFGGETVELVTQTNYTRFGELERVQLGEGTKRVWLSYYFNSNTRRPERSIVDAEASVPKQSDVQFAQDNAGFTTAVAEAAPDQTDTQCFRHDHLGRMTEAWTPRGGCTSPAVPELGGVAPYWHSYRYDKTGNRERETRHAAAGDTTYTYTYPNTGQPHTLRSVTGGGRTESYTYNAAGQTTGRTRGGANETLNWDVEGHLENVTNASGTTSFIYDADGGRLLRKDPAGTTLYLGTQEIRLPAAGGAPVATRYYSYGGKPIAVRTGTKLSWLAGDQRATQLTIDSATLQVNRRRQLPFGYPRGVAPSFWPDERGFVGGTLDPSTGLTHLGAREYDTTTGRFISVDPILDVADPQQMNGYAYGNDNPSTFSDATGLMLSDCGDSSGSCKGLDPRNGAPLPGNTGSNPGHSGGRNGGTYRNNPSYKQPNPGPPLRTGCGGRGSCAPNGTPPRTTPAPKMCTGGSGYGTQVCKADPCGPGMRSYTSYSGRQGCIEGGNLSSEDTHTALDVCGSTGIPFLSQLCDLANAFGYAVEGDLENTGVSLFGLVTGIGDAATIGRAAGKESGLIKTERAAGCSFTGDTMVLMADGSTKPISKVKVGDQVLAVDPKSGERGPRTVTAVMVHDDTVVELHMADGSTIATTEDHPFWNATDKRWERADQLDAGDQLLTANGESARVAGLRPGTRHTAPAYNLTVEDLHTYHVVVGAAPVLVHNDCPVFRTGEWYIDTVTLSDGKQYEFAALNVRADGNELILEDVIVSPLDGSVDWQANRKALGASGAMELRRLLRDRYGAQAARQGYEWLVLKNFERSTGNPGHVGTVRIRVGGG